MMKRLKYLALATLVAFAACDEEGETNIPTQTTVQTGSVSVTVSADNDGLSGVTVTLAGPTAQSAQTAGGSASFSNIEVGNYAVTISGFSADYVFGTTSQSVTVTADQTATTAFTGSVVRTAQIAGQVTAGGNPVEGASVDLDAPAGESDQSRTTGSDGRYDFEDLRSGDYTLTLTAPDGVTCDDTESSVTLEAGGAAIVNFGCAGGANAPEITIERITVGGGGTPVPIDPDSLVGRVEVTVNIDPRGSELSQVLVTGTPTDGGETVLIYVQTFNAGEAAAAPQAIDELDVTASWNTDLLRRRDGTSDEQVVTDASVPTMAPVASGLPYQPIHFNGDYDLTAHVFSTGNDPQAANVSVTLINADAINLGVFSNNNDWVDPFDGLKFEDLTVDLVSGLRWLSGDVVITVYPIVYSAPFDPNNPLYARASAMFSGFFFGGNAVVGGGEVLAPNADGTFTFTFCENAGGVAGPNTGSPATSDPTTFTTGCYASIAQINTGVVGARGITILTKTAFGQFGPGFIPPVAGVNGVFGDGDDDPAGAGPLRNNIKSIEFFEVDLQSGTGLLNDILRIDNESPVFRSMDATNLPHPALAATAGTGTMSRSGLMAPLPLFNLGWVRHVDPLTGLINPPPACVGAPFAAPCWDTPFAYPAAAAPGWGDAQASGGIAASFTDLDGIGLPTTQADPSLMNGHLLYVMGANAEVPPGGLLTSTLVIGGQSVIWYSGASTPVTTPAYITGDFTGAQLPNDAGPGLDDPSLTQPNSNTETDYALAGRHWDFFGNWTNTGIGAAPTWDYLLVGVDGHPPIYSNMAGTTVAVPTDPTVAGTVWDPYDDMQNFLQTPPLLYGREGSVLGGAAAAKPDGAFAGWTTDRGQGFSGIAGVVMRAWESFCLGIDAVCAGQEWTSSPPIGGSVVVYSATGQLVAPAGPTTVLPFNYAAAIPQGVGASAAFVNTFTLVGVDGVWGTRPTTWPLRLARTRPRRTSRIPSSAETVIGIRSRGRTTARATGPTSRLPRAWRITPIRSSATSICPRRSCTPSAPITYSEARPRTTWTSRRRTSPSTSTP